MTESEGLLRGVVDTKKLQSGVTKNCKKCHFCHFLIRFTQC